MFCKGENGGGAKKLCPVSFGLAIGVVGFFVVLFESLWAMHYGASPFMVAMHLPVPTLSGAFAHALLGLLKGFLFGFFVAFLYDWFSCCIACCKKDGSCKSPDKK